MIRMFLLILALSVLTKTAHAEKIQVGISPPRIDAENLLRGSHFEKEVLLSKSKTNEDLSVIINIPSPWITVDQNVTFVFSKDVQSVPLIFSIDIPSDAELGDYESIIDIRVKPKTQLGLNTDLAFQVKTKMTVTDKKLIDYSVSFVKIPEIKEDSPITVLLTIDNKGNFQAKPKKVEVEILDKFKNNLLQTSSHTDLEYVAPFTKAEIPVEVQHSLLPEPCAF